MIIENTEYIFSKEEVHLPFKTIERFEYDFQEDQDMHSGHQLYSQIFAVIGNKRILIGENQITIETSNAKPTKEQKKAVEHAVEAIKKLTGK